ncbi:hypothetical protein [Blastococcus sp. TF02A-26]|uniref:hypothetical protein n=1 Tax=Blastococcus sp. TF02A-26 TaxID=2250577 RepID=UPI000DE84C8B|nr:hypothetical protein [Blastococcus sp. TF02A-26]RBY83991.1 hypothetical protein DQ240_16190 [Blastococcus sp. TF02A-26]
MSSPDVVLELKPPPLATVLSLASVVVGAGLVLAVVRTRPPLLFALLFVAAVVGITGFNLGTALCSARARADGVLEVRNRFRTRRLHRSEIDRVLLGSVGGFGSNRRIELLLLDGTTLPLVGTEAPPFPGTRGRLEDQADQLRSWVDAGI